MRRFVRFLMSALAALVLVSPLVALAAPGSLDDSFGGDGKKTTDFFDRDDRPHGLLTLANNKTVLVGNVYVDDSDRDIGIARYTPGGKFDPDFSGDGKRTIDLGSTGDGAFDVAGYRRGKIVMAGSVDEDSALVRVKKGGGLDSSFGTGGIAIHDLGNSDQLIALAVQPDGKIVAVGSSFLIDNGVVSVARFNPNGTLDTNSDANPGVSFSQDGIKEIDFGYQYQDGMDIALQDDGRILVGAALGGSSDNSQDFAAARLRSQGALDDSFGNGGKKIIAMDPLDDELSGLALDSLERVVLVGTYEQERIEIVRLKRSGGLDDSFSTDGRRIVDDDEPLSGNAVAVQENDRIIVAGSEGTSPNTTFSVARFKVNGTLDSSFGNAGFKRATFLGADTGRDVAIDPLGRIVVSGDTGSPEDFAVARLKSH